MFKCETGKYLKRVQMKGGERWVVSRLHHVSHLQNKLGALLERQAEERSDLDHRLANATKGERQEMLELQDKEHAAEQEELNYMLKLEQDEELEKLRKVNSTAIY